MIFVISTSIFFMASWILVFQGNYEAAMVTLLITMGIALLGIIVIVKRMTS